MKRVKMKIRVIISLIVMIAMSFNVFASSYIIAPHADYYYGPSANQYYNPYAYQYNYQYGAQYNNQYNNQYNGQYNYYPNYNIGNANYLVPADAYYYLIGYDRPAYNTYNGEPNVSRVPVLNGNYPYPTYMANLLIYNAYVSISNWCNSNVLNQNNVQDYFLNFASIESETPYEIVMLVNCDLKKQNAINGNLEFRLTIDVASNRFRWRKINNSSDVRVFEYDSTTGQIIQIN